MRPRFLVLAVDEYAVQSDLISPQLPAARRLGLVGADREPVTIDSMAARFGRAKEEVVVATRFFKIPASASEQCR